jgi:hypothetical protein
LKKLVKHALTFTPSSSDNPDEEDGPIFVGGNIKMYFEGSDGAVKTSWIGHVISTVHILCVFYMDVVEWSRALDVRLSEWCCSVSMVWVKIP